MKILLLAAALVVAATAARADGYHKANGFEQTKAYCELMANQLQPGGGFVFGPPGFVAGSLLGSAIRSQITHAQNYDNCMVLRGYARNQ
jgi:hypothetical protein